MSGKIKAILERNRARPENQIRKSVSLQSQYFRAQLQKPGGGISGQSEGEQRFDQGQIQGTGALTWKAAWAQPRKASSWPQSSSPWPSCNSRSPPSSSSLVSTARAKAQKWGYAREPSPKTQNLWYREQLLKSPCQPMSTQVDSLSRSPPLVRTLT